MTHNIWFHGTRTVFPGALALSHSDSLTQHFSHTINTQTLILFSFSNTHAHTHTHNTRACTCSHVLSLTHAHRGTRTRAQTRTKNRHKRASNHYVVIAGLTGRSTNRTSEEGRCKTNPLGWLGLTDRAEEDTFVWANSGLIVPRNDSKWDSGEPNNKGGDENCVEMLINGHFNDQQCYCHAYFMCQSQ